MEIKVLGSGCANCQKLEKMVFDVLAETGIAASVVKVTDFKEIVSCGVMSTPALGEKFSVTSGSLLEMSSLPLWE